MLEKDIQQEAIDTINELDQILVDTLAEFGEIGERIREKFLAKVAEWAAQESTKLDTSETPAPSSPEQST